MMFCIPRSIPTRSRGHSNNETSGEVQPRLVSHFCHGFFGGRLRYQSPAATKRQTGDRRERSHHDGSGLSREGLYISRDQAAARNADEVLLSSPVGSGVLSQSVFRQIAEEVPRL